MNTSSILPFMVAFMVGLALMRPLDIFQINAWNVGTLKVEPWRTRTSGIARAVATTLARLTRLFQSRRLRRGAVLALALLIAHLASDPAVSCAAITLGTATQMREARERLINEASALTIGEKDKPISFKTAEDRSKFDTIMVDVEAYRVALDDADRGDKLAAMQRASLPESQRSADRDNAAGQQGDPAVKAVYERALGQYIRGVDMGEMQPEERAALRAGYRNFTKEERDMATTSGAAGGFVVAPDTRFYGVILQAMKFFGGMEAAGAEVFNTDTAGALPVPMGDDTGNVGTIVPEALASGHAGGTSPTLSQLILNGYLYSSKVVKVSWQMIRDGAIDVEGYVGGLLGQRLARIQNTHFTATGTGSGQPLALTAAAGGVSVGRQSAVGNTTSVAFDDIYRTVHSIDVAYRDPSCRWMFHDNSALTLRLAKDGQGRYLWPEMGSVQAGQPGVLAGYPFVINNDMAQMAASAKWATFGQHSYYKIRRVKGLTIVRINELYVESGQVGFLAFQSADGGYANPGQNPIKALQNSAT